jgi:peptide/nickel transport system permease protein
MTTTTPDAVQRNPDIFSEILSQRKIGRLEKILGPENYRIVKGLFKTPASIIGISLISFFVLLALLVPLIAPPIPGGDPYKIPQDGFSPVPRPPMSAWEGDQPPLPFWWKPIMGTDSWVHLMGTASNQYDIFYGVLWGARTAFVYGLIIVLCSVLIGILVGAVAAYYGGLTDNILMRIVDIFLTLPFIMAALILSAVLNARLGRSVWPTVIALIAFGWMSYSRLIRGDILSVKERDYILAAKVVGVKDRRILTRHIVPNAIFPTLVYASLAIGDVVLSFAALSFLGIGAPEGYADWGQLLSSARNFITNLNQYWYILLFPGIVLVLFVLGWNLIGDALRDIMDPRMRGKSS